MIKGVHTMFYSSDPDGLRTFLKEKLNFEGRDTVDGWMIFDLPEADMGVHPSDTADGARTGTPSISFYCEDIHKTVAELKNKGVEFKGDIEDHGYGLVTYFKVPGEFYLQLYQPKY